MSSTQPFTWAFSTLGCYDHTLEATMELAQRFGIDALEVRTLEGRMDLPKLFTERYGDVEGLKTALERGGCRIVALDSSHRLLGGSAESRQELLDFATWGEALGMPYLRVFDGGHFEPSLTEAQRAEAVAEVAWWREQRAAHGWSIDIMIETHDSLLTAAHVEALQEALDAPVTVLWDAHHTWKKAGEDTFVTWEALRPYIRHIHIKDSIAEATELDPFTHTLPGKGEFPVQALVERLQAEGFDGVVCLEWERYWRPKIAPLEDALEALRAVMR